MYMTNKAYQPINIFLNTIKSLSNIKIYIVCLCRICYSIKEMDNNFFKIIYVNLGTINYCQTVN